MDCICYHSYKADYMSLKAEGSNYRFYKNLHILDPSSAFHLLHQPQFLLQRPPDAQSLGNKRERPLATRGRMGVGGETRRASPTK